MSEAETRTRETGPGGRNRRRMVLLSESEGLAALLRHLLGAGGTLTRFASLRQAGDADGLADADTVVLDLSRDDDGTTLARVRHRYRGRLVVLAERGQRSAGVAPDPAWTLLERPFSVTALATALGLPGPGAGAAAAPAPKANRYPPLARPRDARRPSSASSPAPRPAPADLKAAANRAPSWGRQATGRVGQLGLLERASRALAALTQSWQARRRVRVAGFSAFALVAFAVAFTVAAQGRCGPGCDPFGTVFSPAPTIAPSDSSAPTTTGPKRPTTSTATRAGSGGAGAFEGVTDGLSSPPTTARRATTTTARSGGGGPQPTTPTTRPPTTRPPTTPPTSEPPTTPPTSEPPTTPPTTAGP